MTHIEWSCLQLPKILIKLFHLVQIWIELLPFAESWFRLLEFTQIFPIHGNIPNFIQTWMK